MMREIINGIIPYVTLTALLSAIVAVYFNLVSLRSAKEAHLSSLLEEQNVKNARLEDAISRIDYINSEISEMKSDKKPDFSQIMLELEMIRGDYEHVLSLRSNIDLQKIPFIDRIIFYRQISRISKRISESDQQFTKTISIIKNLEMAVSEIIKQ